LTHVGRRRLSKTPRRPMGPCYAYGPVWPRRPSGRVHLPTRKEAPQPRARIDNWPPPVCTRSVRLSIGHQETMMPSPFSNRTASRSRCVSSVYLCVRYYGTRRAAANAYLYSYYDNAYNLIPRYNNR